MRALRFLPLIAVAVSLVLSATPHAQQSRTGDGVNTAPGRDPRRLPGASRVVADPQPQADPRGEQDPDRMNDPYRPRGILLGDFMMLPKLELDGTYTDNLFASQTNRRSDYVAIARPEMRLRSRFREHELNLFGQVEASKHDRFANDDVVDARAGVDGRYDLTRDDNVYGRLDVIRRHEERGSDDDAFGREPTAAQEILGKIGAKLRFARLSLIAEGLLNRFSFDNVVTSAGQTVNNHDRNRTELVGSLKASYELFPGYAAVVALTANQRDYDDARDDAGLQRDSTGYRLEGGIGIEIADQLRGDFLVGYLQQNYSDTRLRDPAGLAIKASFNWTPDRSTVIVPTLERSVQETTLLNSSAMVRTTASILARRELARNILVTGYAGVYFDEFSGLSRNSTTYEVRGRLTYAFSGQVYVSGELAFKSKDSQLAGRSYEQSFVGLRLGLQY